MINVYQSIQYIYNEKPLSYYQWLMDASLSDKVNVDKKMYKDKIDQVSCKESLNKR